ncbi:restriction endonuclease [Achromobacter aloeverae]
MEQAATHADRQPDALDAPGDVNAHAAVYFIKLGEKGKWVNECLERGTLRFGYHAAPHDLCCAEQWDEVRKHLIQWRGKDDRVATSDLNQIKKFYTAPADAIFVTFANGFLYWCQARPGVTPLPDGGRERATVKGWSKTSLGGKELNTVQLSGHLLKVQAFRGAICDVSASDYVVRKLTDTPLEIVAAAEDAEAALVVALEALIRRLTWNDFEVFVDLIFTASGWRRVTTVGGGQHTVDMQLVLPTTGERASVQVKGQISARNLQRFADDMLPDSGFGRMFLAWHSGAREDHAIGDGVTLLGPRRLAAMAVDAGLSGWLREKIS